MLLAACVRGMAAEFFGDLDPRFPRACNVCWRKLGPALLTWRPSLDAPRSLAVLRPRPRRWPWTAAAAAMALGIQWWEPTAALAMERICQLMRLLLKRARLAGAPSYQGGRGGTCTVRAFRSFPPLSTLFW